jgi:hypothetical protein
MSRDLCYAYKHNRSYFHSPVDDLWSFYYVTQWAAAFNNSSLDPEGLPGPLLDLRDDLARSDDSRENATTSITSRDGLRSSAYGTFLTNSQLLLAAWRPKLNKLQDDLEWYRENLGTGADSEDKLHQYFKDITKRGVMDYLRLLKDRYPSLV